MMWYQSHFCFTRVCIIIIGSKCILFQLLGHYSIALAILEPWLDPSGDERGISSQSWKFLSLTSRFLAPYIAFSPHCLWVYGGFPGGPVVKNLPASAGDIRDSGLIPGSGRSPEGGHGNPLQHSCLENPMDGGTWQATVRGVAESHTWLKLLSIHATGVYGGEEEEWEGGGRELREVSHFPGMDLKGVLLFYPLEWGTLSLKDQAWETVCSPLLWG